MGRSKKIKEVKEERTTHKQCNWGKVAKHHKTLKDCNLKGLILALRGMPDAKGLYY